jgi:MFS family permease
MRFEILTVAVATMIGSLGLAAGGTAGALIAAGMTGSAASAGLPLGAVVIGSAAGALLISRMTRRADRITGLVLGYWIGAAGAAMVVAATAAASFELVVAGNLVMGVANAAVYLARYAGADAVRNHAARGRALGLVLTGAAAGAIVGPNLLGPTGDIAAGLGLPRLSGLYLVAVAAFPAAALFLAFFGRRSRRPINDGIAYQDKPAQRRPRSAGRGSAVFVLAATNLVMVAVMAVAPVHLVAHGRHLDVIGIVVSVHVLCMLAPAPLAGWLADRAGAPTLARLSAALLATASVTGAVADPDSIVAFTVALAAAGLGWCAGIVAGSMMLADSLPHAQRPRAEGIGEVAMGIAAGVGAPLAGLVIAFSGFRTLVLAASAVSLTMLLPRLFVRGPLTVDDVATPDRGPNRLVRIESAEQNPLRRPADPRQRPR